MEAADFWLRTNPDHPDRATFFAADKKFRENRVGVGDLGVPGGVNWYWVTGGGRL